MNITVKLTAVAENEPKVFEAGKQAEYDTFWDTFQNYGNRKYYYYAFAWQNAEGLGWASEAYNPKYPIVCEGANAANSIFHYSSRMTDVRVPIVVRNTTMSTTFYRCYDLKSIPSLTLENVTDFYNAFADCRQLETIRIYGSIDVDISFGQSPLLTTESVQSIIDALKDLTGATAQTLTLHADVGAKLTDEQKATITAKNWTLVY